MLKGQFELPPGKVYLCGSSLGPMPRAIRQVLCNFQHKWATQAVDGHFDQSAVDSHVVESGWVHCEEQCSRALMPLVGAVDSNEIACLSELSVNLHLLLSAFYPLGAARRGKQKILMESHCFSSDLLVAQSFLRTRGIVDPGAGGSEGILFFPADDDFCTAPHTAMDFIRQHADDIALMLLSPVNYYTGQLFPIEALTQLCHQFDIVVGLDLAHAVGNVPLRLHDWGVDFAAWCTYKYLNGGPGSISGLFVHSQTPYLQEHLLMKGWWGVDDAQRFKFTLDPEERVLMAPGAKRFQVSNPSPLLLECVRTAAIMFPPMDMVRECSHRLTSLCRELLKDCLLVHNHVMRILTPSRMEESGAQLSFWLSESSALHVFHQLSEAGIVGDLRPPHVLRITFCALYNDEEDVRAFCSAFSRIADNHFLS